jgi:pumilio RNA-binding family
MGSGCGVGFFAALAAPAMYPVLSSAPAIHCYVCMLNDLMCTIFCNPLIFNIVPKFFCLTLIFSFFANCWKEMHYYCLPNMLHRRDKEFSSIAFFFIMCSFQIILGFVFLLQEHFGNSASLSVRPHGQQFNGTGDLDEQQFGLSRVHSGGVMANYSASDMGPLWTDMNPDNVDYCRNIQNRSMSNIGKMNAYGNRDLSASYMFDSNLLDALSGLRLSNSLVMDQWNHGEGQLDEILECQRDFSKIGDENRSPLVGNVFRASRSDVHPLPIYGHGISQRQTSALDGSNVSRFSRHHIKGVDHLSLAAERVAAMQSGNLRRGTNLSRNAYMTNMVNPMSNRYYSNTDLDLVSSRRAFLDDLLAQQYLQEDNLSYDDSRIYHGEPRFSSSRMQRPGSHFYPNSRNILSHGDRQSRFFSLNRKAMGRNIGSQVYHDNALANYLDVPSLDNADRNGADSVELIDVVGHVKEVRQVLISFYISIFSMEKYFISFIYRLVQYGSIWKPVYSTKT